MPSFEETIGDLKKPREMGDFGTADARDLQHAMDILAELRQEAYKNRQEVGWEKLQKARQYLDELMRRHLKSDEEKAE